MIPENSYDAQSILDFLAGNNFSDDDIDTAISVIDSEIAGYRFRNRK